MCIELHLPFEVLTIGQGDVEETLMEGVTSVANNVVCERLIRTASDRMT